MKRQTNWIVGVSDGKVHEYKIGDVTYFVSAEFERSSQTNLRDRVQRTVVSNLIRTSLLLPSESLCRWTS